MTPDGQWEYLWMPFGMYNAPPSFQQMMNGVYKDMVGKTLLVYFDNTVVYTSTFDEHIQALREVLQRLCEN